ncbi:glycosyltransferase family 2 protein [Luteitalea sp.]|uniref:glycosyltransferase family 2 protein n=1 Tax=Luteitalea sp. TaxID=2004800 RepID=UPI0025BEA5D2|nr:glycosyltransferase family 2 protein [Luteitalea sp.]
MYAVVVDLLTWLFWLSAAGVAYAYVGYPLLVWWLASRLPMTVPPDVSDSDLPDVTIVVPVHNERTTIAEKLANTEALDYPPEALKAIFVSDGSTDGTPEIIAAAQSGRVRLVVQPERGGKAAALNAGLVLADSPIVVFTDAAILLESGAIRAIVRPFRLPDVGCVSGEDRIMGGGGEGLYGRYEMFLRRQESRLHSIVGASGSFYAQRRNLCGEFVPNVAPDFLSVLRTVEGGFRAVSEPAAVGLMTALDDPRGEFDRKVRTILRGMTTLGLHARLLHPLRYPLFSFELISHKLMRWLVPFFLVVMLAASLVLAADSWFYALMSGLQLLFYAVALVGFAGRLPPGLGSIGRVATYFSAANVATLLAWLKYVAGTRQEIWSPSKR